MSDSPKSKALRKFIRTVLHAVLSVGVVVSAVAAGAPVGAAPVILAAVLPFVAGAHALLDDSTFGAWLRG